MPNHFYQFILLDDVQYMRHSWIERNRILKQSQGWIYIKVPLKKHSHLTLIKDIVIDQSQPWREKLLAQLHTYKKVSRRYDKVYALVHALISPRFDSIVDLNKHVLLGVCNYLGFDPNINVWSQQDLEIINPTKPDEWALNICKSICNVEEYWNPSGGKIFFDRAKYNVAGIQLRFYEQSLCSYNQFRKPFEPSLSIIDVLMCNSPEIVNQMLDEFCLT